MPRPNKAHTATAHRIARRYGAEYNDGEGIDIPCESFAIEVETTATIREAVARLAGREGLFYVAVTNKEAIQEALRLTEGTRVGVMDPQGNIVKQAVARG
jgi:hypothetical protein